MLNEILVNFYTRDIRKLIEEVNLFRDESNLWKTAGTINNSSGNLVLHIIGGMNYLFGTQLAKNGYVRNRDQEFSTKGVPRTILVTQLAALIPLITNTINAITEEHMKDDYPMMFDGGQQSKGYVVVQLLAHLNYHLGQVNYLRRTLE